MSKAKGGKTTWMQERARRARGWKRLQKSKPAGGGSKYAKKKASKET